MKQRVGALLIVSLVGCLASPDLGETTQEAKGGNGHGNGTKLKDKCLKKPKKKCSTATATIGVAGGTVSNSDGLTLSIPFGALDHDTTLTITTTTLDSDPSVPGAIGPVYAFEPEGTVFARPVDVTLPLPTGVTHASVYWTKLGSSQFALLGGQISGANVVVSTYHFSLAQLGDEHDPPVKGKAAITWITSTNRNSIDSQIAPTDVVAIVDNNVGGYAAVCAHPDPDDSSPGSFELTGIRPGGEYLIKAGTNYLITSDPTPDLGLNRGGKPLGQRTAASQSTFIDLDVHGIEGWQQPNGSDPGDQLEFFSTEANDWRFQAEGTAPSTLVTGQQTTLLNIPMDGFVSGGLEPPSRIVTSDTSFVAQLRSRQAPTTNFQYQAMSRFGLVDSFATVEGGHMATPAHVDLSTLVPASFHLDATFHGQDWGDALSNGDPRIKTDCGICGGWVAVLAQAGFTADGFYTANADLLIARDLPGNPTALHTGDMEYMSAGALAAAQTNGKWGPLMLGRWGAYMNYVLPGTPGHDGSGGAFLVTDWVATSPESPTPLAAPIDFPSLISQPWGIEVNGISWTVGSTTKPGPSPTITWHAPVTLPAAGAADVLYTITVFEVSIVGGLTHLDRIAAISTFDTSFTFPTSIDVTSCSASPTSILAPNKSYAFTLTTTAGTTAAGAAAIRAEPLRAGVDRVTTITPSAIFGDGTYP